MAPSLLGRIAVGVSSPPETALFVNLFYWTGALEVENLKAVYTQLEPMPQKYLTKTHLTIISKLHQLQHQLKIIELGEIQTLTQQVKEQQELLENLDASTEALHDRTRNWEQWHIVR